MQTPNSQNSLEHEIERVADAWYDLVQTARISGLGSIQEQDMTQRTVQVCAETAMILGSINATKTTKTLWSHGLGKMNMMLWSAAPARLRKGLTAFWNAWNS